MSHIHYDKCPENSDQVIALYANAAMGKTTKPNVENKKDFKELTYTKSYSGWQRAGRLCEGLFLSVVSGCFGLIDIRVRHKFTAAFEGKVEKKVFIDESIYNKAISELDGSSAFLGKNLLEENRLDDAIKVLKDATEKDPSNAFALGLLGEAYRLKELDEAVRLKELGKVPMHSPTMNPDKSGITHLKKSIELDPENVFAHARLGATYRYSASFCEKGSDVGSANYKLLMEKAKESLQTAIHLNPNDIFSHKELALLLRTEGDIIGSLKHIQKAYDLDREAKVDGRKRVMTFDDKIALIEISAEARSKVSWFDLQQPIRTVIIELLEENKTPSKTEYTSVGKALMEIPIHKEEAQEYLDWEINKPKIY